jgi:alcohol dehydrogenase (cytochrome c)
MEGGMKFNLIAALFVIGALPMIGQAQTASELVSSDTTPANVLTYGMGYAQHRFSALKQIDRDTVKRLVPAWVYSMSDNRGQEAQALVKDGVIFLTDHEKTVAVDAMTGKELWKSMIEYAPETTRVVCCGIVNRGGALFDGKLYRTTLDDYVIALDARTGSEVWRTKSSEPKDGYSMTSAPLVVNAVVIVGVSGAEYGARGYLEGYDAQTGARLWRTYTIPGPGEAGSDSWPPGTASHGGGSTWVTGSYDAELDLVFWGTGNPAPWNPLNRRGDNLYTNSVLAVRPQTGEVVWHYQMSPNDPFDYDGVNEWIVADLAIGGSPRKVIMQANRNGFLYVIDRANGKLLAANPFVKVTWADRIDLATGRPVWSADTKKVIESGGKMRVYPSVSGGKNWGPMSFSPVAHLLYINTLDFGMDYETAPVEQIANLKPGDPHYGVKFPRVFDPDKRGYLRAVDPLTGKALWEVPFKSPNIAGTLVTAGGLVFTGQLTGEFMAFNSDTGERLWEFQTSSGVVGQPITWERNGKQYVTVTSGTGGVYALKSGDPNLAHVPAGGSLWTFKLFEEYAPQRTSSTQ